MTKSASVPNILRQENAMVPLMIGMAAPVLAVIAYALLTDRPAERDEEEQ